MQLTQKSQYALRALFELALRAAASPDDPVLPACAVAQAQAIPKRFLDGILLELRQGGFVEARRGKSGGFLLARPAAEISVGEVLRFLNGPLRPVDCRADSDAPCPLRGTCVFESVWEEARQALEAVYDSVSLAELVRRQQPRGLLPVRGAEIA